MKRAVMAAVMVSLLLTTVYARAAEDFLYGEVLDVDREAMQMTIRTGAEETGEVVRVVTLSEALLVENRAGDSRLPGCLQAGKHVRVWGVATVEDKTNLFLAEAVRGCGMTSCSDPTGVRERLKRGRKWDAAGGQSRP